MSGSRSIKQFLSGSPRKRLIKYELVIYKVIYKNVLKPLFGKRYKHELLNNHLSLKTQNRVHSCILGPDSPSVGPGKLFTANKKAKIRDLNMQKNNGYLRSDLDGTFLTISTRGGNLGSQAEVDHIIPRSKGGSNSTRNAQVLSKKQNGQKSNH